MVAPIIITKKIAPDMAADHRTYWRGTPFISVVTNAARDMGDQGRVNIIRFGGPGGEWQKLQGYNQHVQRKGHGPVQRGTVYAKAKARAARKEIKQLNKIDVENWHKLEPMSAEKQGRVAALKLQLQGLPHSGYARAKALGRTPGHGKFGPDVRLRDTGALAASLDGNPTWTNNGARIVLVARGRGGNRPANQSLLLFHHKGLGHNPVRSPVQDMRLYDTRTATAWGAFVRNAPKLKTVT